MARLIFSTAVASIEKSTRWHFYCSVPNIINIDNMFLWNHVFGVLANCDTLPNRCCCLHSPSRWKYGQSIFSRHSSCFNFYCSIFNAMENWCKVKKSFRLMLLYTIASFLWSHEKVSWHSIYILVPPHAASRCCGVSSARLFWKQRHLSPVLSSTKLFNVI